ASRRGGTGAGERPRRSPTPCGLSIPSIRSATTSASPTSASAAPAAVTATPWPAPAARSTRCAGRPEARGASDPAQLHLHVAGPVVVEGADAGGEIALVVVPHLIAPALPDGRLVRAEASEPLGGGTAVVAAA